MLQIRCLSLGANLFLFEQCSLYFLIGGCALLQQDIIFLFEETDFGQFSKLVQFAINMTSINMTVSKTETRVGAISFSAIEQNVWFGLKNYSSHREVQGALQSIQVNGTNNTMPSNASAALHFVRNNFLSSAYGDRKRISNYVILMSSATDVMARQVSDEMRSDNFTTVIGIGANTVDMNELTSISGSSGNTFYVNNWYELDVTLSEKVRRRLPYCFYCKLI